MASDSLEYANSYDFVIKARRVLQDTSNGSSEAERAEQAKVLLEQYYECLERAGRLNVFRALETLPLIKTIAMQVMAEKGLASGAAIRL